MLVANLMIIKLVDPFVIRPGPWPGLSTRLPTVLPGGSLMGSVKKGPHECAYPFLRCALGAGVIHKGGCRSSLKRPHESVERFRKGCPRRLSSDVFM